MPADERAAQREEGLVDVGPALEARTQSAHLMQPSDRALHYPTFLAQPRAMRRAAPSDERSDVQQAQPTPVRLGIVGPVAQQRLGASARASALAPHWRHGLHQRAQLHGVVAVGARDARSQRHALRVRKDMVLAAFFLLSTGLGPVWSPA